MIQGVGVPSLARVLRWIAPNAQLPHTLFLRKARPCPAHRSRAPALQQAVLSQTRGHAKWVAKGLLVSCGVRLYLSSGIWTSTGSFGVPTWSWYNLRSRCTTQKSTSNDASRLCVVCSCGVRVLHHTASLLDAHFATSADDHVSTRPRWPWPQAAPTAPQLLAAQPHHRLQAQRFAKPHTSAGAAGSPCTCCRFAYAFPRARTHVARHSTHIPRIHTHTLSLSAVVGQARPRACRFAAAPQPLRGRKTGPQRRPTSGRGAIPRRCGVGQARKRACFATWDHTKHAPFITPGRGFDHRGRPWSIPTCSLLAFTQALPACLTMPSLGPERCLSVRTRGPPPLLKFACHRPLSPAASACLCLRALITGPTSWGTQTRQPSRAMARLLMRLPPSGPRDSEYPSHSTVTVRGHE